MATPKEALIGAVQTININSQAVASPRNQSIGSTDSVQFKNNDSSNDATVTFEGAGADVFTLNGVPVTTVSVPYGGGVVGPLTPTENVTVNYGVTVGAKSGGTFAIQVADGSLEIDIVDDEGNTNLGEAEIPNNGSLFFNNETDDNATIHFGGDQNVLYDANGNAVTSQPVGANTSGGVLTGRGTNKNVTYTIAMTVAQADGGLGGGNGSIKVGQT